MSITTFQFNLNLIKTFVTKLRNETISHRDQRVLLKSYANLLNLNLTDSMIDEVLLTLQI
ncbi:hypothetical protein [Alkaliphilus transvaalensis]|uniref:hypothetical protein n=1 Tax=Alkaliphilus transvaalensis TaxID=114628 RepID=UPI00047D1EBF|nr:hypothetical protein [Alkaliphilus transvaalensis]